MKKYNVKFYSYGVLLKEISFECMPQERLSIIRQNKPIECGYYDISEI